MNSSDLSSNWLSIQQLQRAISWLVSVLFLFALGGWGAVHGAEKLAITDKTLVAWIAPANLDQRGGSVLTLERAGGVFDAIVLGELVPAKWMPGSNNFARTQRRQDDFPLETADEGELVQIAIVYQGQRINVYRNGAEYAAYTADGAERFGGDSVVLMGLRHLDAAAPNRFFTGSIEDARLYGEALRADQIAALQPNQPSQPEPLAWWDFEDGSAADRRQTFPATTLLGDARVVGGRLHLKSEGAYLLASRTTPESAAARPRGNDVDRSSRELRERLLLDPHRPGYHFVIPEGRGMPFDPNGAIFWKGRYHLFYIFQDQRGHNWGHVSSRDLFHWRHHPTGLISGMFSGNCFLNREGVPTMCYHQVGQGNAMAVALDDELNEWKKLDSNPITPRTRPGDPHHDQYQSWDPYGWVEDNTYYAIFGGKRPAVAKAERLEGDWRYVGDLMANTVPGVAINEDVSCADFFRLGDRRMLLCISHTLGCRYYLGEWKNEQFHPDVHEQMSWVDNSFFAPESLVDDQGRRIMWAWIKDRPTFQVRDPDGWSGTMSLPRVLSLGSDGGLRMNPPREIEALRYHERSRSDFLVAAGPEIPWEGIEGSSLELNLVIEPQDARECGVVVCRSRQGEEQTRIVYDAMEKKLKVDTRKSSLTEGPGTVEAGPLALGETESLRLRIFVDKSVVEVFANDRQAVMRRVYPSRDDSIGVAFFSGGGDFRVKSLQVWDLMPSNPY